MCARYQELTASTRPATSAKPVSSPIPSALFTAPRYLWQFSEPGTFRTTSPPRPVCLGNRTEEIVYPTLATTLSQ